MADFAAVAVIVKHENAITEYPMVGEVIAPGLAITPAVYHGGFTGKWTVTHTPSGWSITRANVCLPCVRRNVHILTDADVDWTRVRDAVVTDPKAIVAASAFRDVTGDCTADDCGWIADHLAELGEVAR